MIRFYINRLTLMLLLAFSIPSQAAVTLQAEWTAVSAQQVDVGIVISGLTADTVPSLGVYDLDIVFDSSHLAYTGTRFGGQLDVQQLGLNFPEAVLLGPDTINLSEVSVNDATALDSLQLNSFTIATLSFDVLKASTSQLNMAVQLLGDANGNAFAADISPATITTVPLPSAFFLMLPVVVGFAAKLRRVA